MSQAICTVPSVGAHRDGLLHGAGARVARTLDALRREWEIRRDLRLVSAMDAHELADIGIGPGAAEGAVRYGRSRIPAPRPAPPAPLMPASWTEWR